MNRPSTVGELKETGYRPRSVKEELRANLRRALAAGENPFEGIHGYERTVLPSLHNAILSRHDLLLLGLRGQAKTRLLRMLVNLLDPEIPAIAGSELNEDPLRTDHQVRPPDPGREGRRDAARLDPARRALPGEARHARRDDRGPDRRRGPDQGRHRAPLLFRRGSHPLRHRAPHQPRHLRDQRAAGSAAPHPGGPAEHPRGAGPADPRLPDPHPARHPARLLGQPGGLHQPRQHHHAAEGPDLLADPDALPRRREDRREDHGAGGLARPGGRSRASRSPTSSAS